MTIKLSPATKAVATFAAQCSNHSMEAESTESHTLVHRLQDEVTALECYHAAFRADVETALTGARDKAESFDRLVALCQTGGDYDDMQRFFNDLALGLQKEVSAYLEVSE